MKNIDELRSIINDHKEELKQTYGVTEIGVFGSFVRDDNNENSDLDILA